MIETKRLLCKLPDDVGEYIDINLDWNYPLSINCRYLRRGYICECGVVFGRVFAVRTRTEGFCAPWHIEECYECLVEINPSSWVEEVKGDSSVARRLRGDSVIMRHYMIYLAEFGCIEVISDTWKMKDEMVVGSRAGPEKGQVGPGKRDRSNK